MNTAEGSGQLSNFHINVTPIASTTKAMEHPLLHSTATPSSTHISVEHSLVVSGVSEQQAQSDSVADQVQG